MVKAIGLLSPVMVPMIVSGIHFFSSEKRNKPKLFLAFYMLVITYIFLANYFYFEHNYEVYIYLHSLHIATVLAIYPGAYIYIRLLTYSEGNKRRAFLHLLPSLLFLLLSAGIFFPFLSVEERCAFLSEYRFSPDFSKTWMKILYYIRMANIGVLFIQVFLYVFLIWRLLKKHRRKVVNIFSNPEKFQLDWLRTFNFALALSALVCVFMYTVDPAKLFGDDRYLSYPLLIVAVILWFLGIMGNNQAPLPELEMCAEEHGSGGVESVGVESGGVESRGVESGGVESGGVESGGVESGGVESGGVESGGVESGGVESGGVESGALVEELEQYFGERKAYLDSDLTIYDVAKELGTNRTYISQTINTVFGKNFSGFVNSYRLREAKRLIDEGSDDTLMAIATECGFGSVSSLGRSFKAEYGVSVGEYREKGRG